MSIHTRLRALERLQGEECPECGAGQIGGPVTFVVLDEASPESPKECPQCGRVLRFTLDIGEAGVIKHGKR